VLGGPLPELDARAAEHSLDGVRCRGAATSRVRDEGQDRVDDLGLLELPETLARFGFRQFLRTSGRIGVQRSPEAAVTASTARCSSAIGLPAAEGSSTLPDDSSTTCSTPASLAAAAKSSAPSVGA
jgi:hypothetical protein